MGEVDEELRKKIKDESLSKETAWKRSEMKKSKQEKKCWANESEREKERTEMNGKRGWRWVAGAI